MPGQRVFQDWHAWMKEGIIDLAMPMNYARESNPTTRAWFDGWIRWEKEHKHGRQLAIGLGNFLNRPEATLAQVERVRRNEGDIMAEGLVLYSYATPATAAARARGRGPSASSHTRDLLEYLVQGPYPAPGPFLNPVPIPTMDWIENPQMGWLAGVVVGSNGKPIDGAAVVLVGTGEEPSQRRMRTISDGTGYFGFADLAPGRYEVELEKAGTASGVQVDIQAARLSRITLVAP
jgi:hypothetical protein